MGVLGLPSVHTKLQVCACVRVCVCARSSLMRTHVGITDNDGNLSLPPSLPPSASRRASSWQVLRNPKRHKCLAGVGRCVWREAKTQTQTQTKTKDIPRRSCPCLCVWRERGLERKKAFGFAFVLHTHTNTRTQAKITEVLFGQGVLRFCKAEAMQKVRRHS